MRCSACQAEIPDAAKFCHQCGAALRRTCGSCGSEVPSTARFCGECGASVASGASAASAGASGGAPTASGPCPAAVTAAAAAAASAPGSSSEPPSFLAPDSERRQMTVLFCDMVGSTHLSTWVDAEDLRDVMSTYIRAAETVIRSFDGHVANYIGDGVMAYFGYPRAHEDDARRACLAGLGIVDAIPALSERLERQFGVRLAVRVGVHTGPTVVGTVGGDKLEIMAVGETPNVASRLQNSADHNTVVISETTANLVGGYFEWQPLGPHSFKGLDEPVQVYRLTRPTGIVDRVTAQDDELLGPMVGREAELQGLIGRWSDCVAGKGRVVHVRGGAGIGKSRLVRALQAHIGAADHEWLVCRGSEYNVDSPLQPVVELAPTLWGFETTDSAEVRSAKVDARVRSDRLPATVITPLVCQLLGLPVPDGHPPLAMAPQVQRERLLDGLAETVALRAAERPVVLVAEDQQWMDQSTVEWLDRVASRRHGLALLLVIVGREALPAAIDVDTEVALRRLPRDEAERLIANVAGGKRLPESVVGQVLERADGNPLYLEELTKTALASGALVEGEDAFVAAGPAAEVTIPASLQESLMARLDRIAPAKTVVQLGATVGRTFAFAIVRDVLRLDDAKVAAELDRLVAAGILGRRGSPPDATYAFRQTLVRDAAYESMTRKTRRHFHAQVAAALAAADGGARPEVLAHHYAAAGDQVTAARLWHEAGGAALGSFALVESIHHLRKGLEALAATPPGADRLAAELGMRVTLGVPLMLTQGFASDEVADHYSGLLELCDEAEGAEDALFPALYGLWTYYEVSAQYARAEDVGRRLLDLAERSGDSGVRLGGHVAYGAARLMRGDLRAAREHFEAGLAVYDPRAHPALAMLFGQDGGAMCASFLTWVHAHDGDEMRAGARAEEALRLCEALDQPGTWSFVHTVLASSCCLRGEAEQGATHARAAVALGEEHLMPHWAAQGNLNLGWALTLQGKHDEAVELMGGAFAVWRALGTRAATSYFEGALASAELARGDLGRASEILDALFAFVELSDERYYVPELLRLRAELERARGAKGAAAAVLEEAMRLAREQGAIGLASRVAGSQAALAEPVPDAPPGREPAAPVKRRGNGR